MKKLVLRCLNPLVWITKNKSARKLRSFALAEHSSMLDLGVAARLTPSPARAALYLKHANDEARHAKVFWKMTQTLTGRPQPYPRADMEHLFESLGEERFLAFVHVGETRGCEQFESYVAHFEKQGDHEMAAMFSGVLSDEVRHRAYTLQLLRELAGSRGAVLAIRSVRRWERWRLWRRAGTALSARLYTVLMWLLYVATLPLVLLVAWKRAPKGWHKEAA